VFLIGNEEFHLLGKRLLYKGFLEIAPFLGPKDLDSELPDFKEKQTYKV